MYDAFAKIGGCLCVGEIDTAVQADIGTYIKKPMLFLINGLANNPRSSQSPVSVYIPRYINITTILWIKLARPAYGII